MLGSEAIDEHPLNAYAPIELTDGCDIVNVSNAEHPSKACAPISLVKFDLSLNVLIDDNSYKKYSGIDSVPVYSTS